MRRVFFAVLLALMLLSWGCVGYRRGYESSYSPGCYNCSNTREHHEGHHSGRHRDHGGEHHHRGHEEHHHRRH